MILSIGQDEPNLKVNAYHKYTISEMFSIEHLMLVSESHILSKLCICFNNLRNLIFKMVDFEVFNFRIGARSLFYN